MKYKDLRQSRKYADYMKSIGWGVCEVSGNFTYCKTIALVGQVIKIQRPTEKVNPSQFKKQLPKRLVNYLLVEPNTSNDLKYFKNTFKMKITKSPSLPTKTVQINLLLSENKLLSDMHYKTRYNIGLSKRRGVVVKNSKNINKFTDKWLKSAKERGLYLSLRKEIISIYQSFGKDAEILFAYKGRELLAGILLLHTEKVSNYMYAFSNSMGKKLFAPTLLVWNAINQSKKRGSEAFDFEGIYDERFPLKTWKGFTRFKKSFGGKIVCHPGPLSKLYIHF